MAQDLLRLTVIKLNNKSLQFTMINREACRLQTAFHKCVMQTTNDVLEFTQMHEMKSIVKIDSTSTSHSEFNIVTVISNAEVFMSFITMQLLRGTSWIFKDCARSIGHLS